MLYALVFPREKYSAINNTNIILREGLTWRLSRTSSWSCWLELEGLRPQWTWSASPSWSAWRAVTTTWIPRAPPNPSRSASNLRSNKINTSHHSCEWGHQKNSYRSNKESLIERMDCNSILTANLLLFWINSTHSLCGWYLYVDVFINHRWRTLRFYVFSIVCCLELQLLTLSFI